jgi:Uma2 family endonuclease
MTTLSSNAPVLQNDYPTSDGKPMAETERHRDLMLDLIKTLKHHWRDQPRICVSGNLLVYYERGNRRRHVSPDVFVVRGVANHIRLNYLIWEERRGPEAVIELTSSSTRNEDLHTKFSLYQDTLKVREYFLFDPYGDYLDPPLRGYRLRQGQYRPIRAVQGRLPSQVMGLHLERDGQVLRLWNPATGTWLPTPDERAEQAEAEVERLRQELARLRESLGENGN